MKDKPELFGSLRLALGIPSCSERFFPKLIGRPLITKRNAPPCRSLSSVGPTVCVHPIPK